MSTIEKKEESPLAVFKSSLELEYGAHISNLLSKKYNITAEEFIVTVLTAVKKEPKLLAVSRSSLFSAVLACAQVGLAPSTPEQLCFILPYKGKAELVIGYKGFIEMAHRSPAVKSITCGVVFQDEMDQGLFVYKRGLETVLEHTPILNRAPDLDKSKKIYCAYAIVTMEGSDKIVEVLDANQLAKIKSLSPSSQSSMSPYNNGTDVSHWMEKKAVIKQVLKTIPKKAAPGLAEALDVDNKLMAGMTLKLNETNKTIEFENEAKDADTKAIEARKSSFFEGKTPEAEPIAFTEKKDESAGDNYEQMKM